MPSSPILVGRENEIAQLEAARVGPGQVILVSGETGIGKSRLLRDFGAEIARTGDKVAWGRPEVIAVPGPYSLILDLLDNIAATLGGPAGSEALALSEQLSDPGASKAVPPASLSRHVAARLRGLLASTVPPPVVFLEDLHSVDEASLTVVFHIARTAHDDGRLLVASTRTDTASENGVNRILDALRQDHILTELPLDRLTPEQVAEVVELSLGHVPENDYLQEIQRMSEGLPFFVEELVSESARLPDSSGPTLPQAIRDSVARRFDALPESVREVVLYAALLDGPIHPTILALVLRKDPDSIAAIAAAAVSSGLLVERSGSIVFRHSLVRQVLASLEDDQRRSVRHRELGDTLVSLYGTSPVHAWQIAKQFRSALENMRAADFALSAGNYALSVAATADARTAFESAATWMATDDIVRKASEGLALAELRDGNDRAAVEHSRSVVDLLKKHGKVEEAASSLGRLSLILTRAGDREAAAVALDEALELLNPALESAVAVRLMTQKANFLTFYMGEFDKARSLIERAILLANSLAEHAVLAVAFDGKAEIHAAGGEFSAAEATGEESLRIALESADPEAIGRTHNNHAARLVLHGRARAGMDVLNTGRGYIEHHYGSAGVSSLDITRAWTHQMQGEPQAALDLLQNLKSVWMSWRGLAAAIKVWAHLERGDRVESDILLRHAWLEAGFRGWRDVAQHGGALNPDVLELLAAEVQVQTALGHLPEAAGASATYRTLSQESGQPSEWVKACAFNALTLALGGQLPRARAELQALDSLLSVRPYPYWMAARHEISGVIEDSVGNKSAAFSHYTQAASIFATCSNSLDQARCLRRSAEANTSPESDTSKEFLSRARELALAAGGLTELSRIESLLRRSGVRPRAGRPRKGTPTRGLSAREEQIASLVAAGSTNTEIAKQLFLSESTVAGHISSALRRLGLSSRAALAAWAAKAGLI